ncbi:MAG: nucleotidyltransferase family protein [Pseudomonadota bacterium]|nr:nucleotidyltransferase family protein [Pseudomonadota bacterium]
MMIAAIILAAGQSKRFGRCKQLANFNGKSLLNHAIDEVRQAVSGPIYVVLGASRDEIAPTITTDVEVVVNSNWTSGMGSSIAVGVACAARQNDLDGILIAVCDQVRVTQQDYRHLTDRFDGRSVISAQYGSANGVPAIFPRSMFSALEKLDGEIGARRILNKESSPVTKIPMDHAGFDVDTPLDLCVVT